MRVAASFRDPSGFMYQRDGQFYRQINPSYAPHFTRLIESNLYQHLTERHLLIEHDLVDLQLAATPDAWPAPHVQPAIQPRPRSSTASGATAAR